MAARNFQQQQQRIGGISAAAAARSAAESKSSSAISSANPSESDCMFMDDLTFTSPSSMVGSPSGLSSCGIAHSPSSENLNTSLHATASAIPIKKTSREKELMLGSHLPPASAPQPQFEGGPGGEFDYVQRRIRKTSVDERRVSFLCGKYLHVISDILVFSLPRGVRTFLHMFPRSPVS